MVKRGQVAGVLLVGLGLLLLGAWGWVYVGGCGPGGEGVTPAAGPTVLPTFTPYVPPTWTPVLGFSLRVNCNAPADLHLKEVYGGQTVVAGRCAPQRGQDWLGLSKGKYDLLAEWGAGGMELQRRFVLDTDLDVAMDFPGVLEIVPVPATAGVKVEAQWHGGRTRLTFPAARCPLTVTVVVEAAGYETRTLAMLVEAGQVNRYTATLVPALVTPQPTRRPGPTAVRVTPVGPTAVPAWTQERLQELVYRMWQNFNQVRRERGLPEVEYDMSLQAQANEAARQFYVTDRAISREQLDAIVAPGWWTKIANNFELAGGTCGIPADYDPAWNYTFVFAAAAQLSAETKAITYGFYGPYRGTCGVSISLIIVGRH